MCLFVLFVCLKKYRPTQYDDDLSANEEGEGGEVCVRSGKALQYSRKGRGWNARTIPAGQFSLLFRRDRKLFVDLDVTDITKHSAGKENDIDADIDGRMK